MGDIEIIPAVNAETFENVKNKIRLVEPYVEWVHLDVTDGTFTKNSIWHNASDLVSLDTLLNIEVHLMILDIERRAPEWLLPNIKRVIFNLEASHNPDFVIEKLREANKEVGISIAPATPWMRLKPYLDKVDLIQILSVNPGLAGQEFIENNLDKIRHLRGVCPKCIIEVDGGMKVGVIKKVVEAGTNIAVAASAIFERNDIRKAIEELEMDAK